MNIKELQPRQGNIELEGTITEVGEIRSFSKFGKPGRVATAKIKDETGEVKLSLWNEQVDQVHVGDSIRLKDGWCDEWRGDLQVSTGRKGTLEILGSSGAKAPSKGKSQPKEEIEEEDLF